MKQGEMKMEQVAGQDRSAAQYDKMTKTPIPKLIVKLGIPTTVSMLVTHVYNMVDTFFVGKLGTSASGATGIVFGFMAILQAVGFMLGQGAGSLISRRLGKKMLPQPAFMRQPAFSGFVRRISDRDSGSVLFESDA